MPVPVGTPGTGPPLGVGGQARTCVTTDSPGGSTALTSWEMALQVSHVAQILWGTWLCYLARVFSAHIWEEKQQLSP